jgi:hypothetical protein
MHILGFDRRAKDTPHSATPLPLAVNLVPKRRCSLSNAAVLRRNQARLWLELEHLQARLPADRRRDGEAAAAAAAKGEPSPPSRAEITERQIADTHTAIARITAEMK